MLKLLSDSLEMHNFADLCVPYSEKQDELLETLKEMIDVGFRNVAIEQIHHHSTVSSKNGDPIPAPEKLDDLREKTKGKLNLLNRLTIVYSEPSITHITSRSQNFKKYHIVAALPTSEAALQHACQTFQGDIITYNSNTIKTRINRKFYYVAIRRHMFFEIKYAPAIVNSNDRRAIITRAQQYHMSGKSKGIIITSEAKNRFQVRSPYDIASLGLIFGLSEELSKCAISTTCQKVLVAAESRRLGRTPVLMRYEDVSTSEEDEEMKSSQKRRGSSVELKESKKIKGS